MRYSKLQPGATWFNWLYFEVQCGRVSYSVVEKGAVWKSDVQCGSVE